MMHANHLVTLVAAAGAGKTVLLYGRPTLPAASLHVILTSGNNAQVVEYVSADSTALHGIAYCDFRNPDSQSLAHTLGSLLGQLCTQLGTLPDGLLEAYRRYGKPATYSG